MDLGLNGKVALVAASSRGIGRATAAALAAEGARVVMCARDRDPLEQAADRICADTGADVYAVPTDLSTEQGPAQLVQTTLELTGALDILVTNTGGPPVGTFDELSDQAWQDAFGSLVMSVVRLVRAAAPAMKGRGGGRVINVTSVSVKQPIPGLMLSNALRAAVVGMAKTLSRELAPAGILVNNVCPGRIATDRLNQLDATLAQRSGIPLEQVRQQAQQSIPLGRYGQPEELASLITFLASGKASYITGETILCDGGLYGGLT